MSTPSINTSAPRLFVLVDENGFPKAVCDSEEAIRNMKAVALKSNPLGGFKIHSCRFYSLEESIQKKQSLEA